MSWQVETARMSFSWSFLTPSINKINYSNCPLSEWYIFLYFFVPTCILHLTPVAGVFHLQAFVLPAKLLCHQPSLWWRLSVQLRAYQKAPLWIAQFPVVHHLLFVCCWMWPHWLQLLDFCLSESHVSILPVFWLYPNHAVCDISSHDRIYQRLLQSYDISHLCLIGWSIVLTPNWYIFPMIVYVFTWKLSIIYLAIKCLALEIYISFIRWKQHGGLFIILLQKTTKILCTGYISN